MDTQENVQQPQSTQQVQETLDAVIAQYQAMTREQLTQELKNQIESGDFEQLRMRVPLIRNAFQALPKPELQTIETAAAQTDAADKEQQNSDSAEDAPNKASDGNNIADQENNTADQENNTADQENNTPSQQAPKAKAPAQDPVEKEFYGLYNLYKEKRQQYLEQQEVQKQENLKQKQGLLEQLKQLLDSEKTLKEIYDDFNAIQDKWKQVGNVPHTEVNNLWENYHFLIDKFYEKVKINRELRDLDLKKNLEEKLALCEKAEELLLTEDINTSFQILQQYHKQWKEIGAVPNDKSDEVWERFKKASDDINARRKEYYDKKTGELEENLRQKQEIVNQAIEINSHVREKLSQWNSDADLMNSLVEKWKTIGPVPHQNNDEIWSKFKAQKDGFFEARKEMFAHSKQMEEENYNKKLNICERAEAIEKRTDFDQATKELLALQQEWKQIGYVRKTLSDQVWARFRAACDGFFKNKSEEYMRTHQEAEENIKKKEELIEQLKAQEFTDDKVKNVEMLKDFQKRWFEVGFTPKQERQKLQKQWDDIITANKEKLQITAAEITQRGSRFLNNVAKMAEGGKEAVNSRIRLLDKQIDSLENNIGFLSGSKNADILKKEFENKINRLKSERENLLQHLKQIAKPKNTEVEENAQQIANQAEQTTEEVKNEENN
ncbi:MAG: DUF349 domain-containing protein [Bacteroidales bacterium]|nr:DUF349 domain-containing protein [Bacteroidales bacterium]